MSTCTSWFALDDGMHKIVVDSLVLEWIELYCTSMVTDLGFDVSNGD